MHGAVAADDLVGRARVVESAVAERHRLDRATGHGAAEGDAAQLGHHGGGEAVRQRGPHQCLEGDTGLGGARHCLGIDLQDVRQRRRVDRAAREPAVTGQRHDVVHAALVDVGDGPGAGRFLDRADDDANSFVMIHAPYRRASSVRARDA